MTENALFVFKGKSFYDTTPLFYFNYIFSLFSLIILVERSFAKKLHIYTEQLKILTLFNYEM